jgi:hypothetical protein
MLALDENRLLSPLSAPKHGHIGADMHRSLGAFTNLWLTLRVCKVQDHQRTRPQIQTLADVLEGRTCDSWC